VLSDTCKAETEQGKLRGPNGIYLCGADGYQRTVTGGLGKVRVSLCDFHAQIFIDRGYDVVPQPSEAKSKRSLESLTACSKSQGRTKQLKLL